MKFTVFPFFSHFAIHIFLLMIPIKGLNFKTCAQAAAASVFDVDLSVNTPHAVRSMAAKGNATYMFDFKPQF